MGVAPWFTLSKLAVTQFRISVQRTDHSRPGLQSVIITQANLLRCHAHVHAHPKSGPDEEKEQK